MSTEDPQCHNEPRRGDTFDSIDTVTYTPKQRQQRERAPHSQVDSHNLTSKVHFDEQEHPAYARHGHSKFDNDHSHHNDEMVGPGPHQDQRYKSIMPLNGNGIAAFKSPPNTPSARTGPPRSVAFAYALPASPSLMSAKPSQAYFQQVTEEQLPADMSLLGGDLEAEYSFNSAMSSDDKDFRGALEYRDLQERDLRVNTRGKRRQRTDSGNWDINPRKWFHESPKDEKPPMALPSVSSPSDTQERRSKEDEHERDTTKHEASHSEPEGSSRPASFFLRRSPKRGSTAIDTTGAQSPTDKTSKMMRRAFSVPPSESKARDNEKEDTTGSGAGTPTITSGTVKWGKLRAMLPHLVHNNESILPGPSTAISQAVNITDELIAGGLSMLMLRLWMERDEKGHRRIPVLFHRLRLRVSDSLHPMERHGVFRIECEYANGAARWVVYRELKDFISLHAHYTVSNMYNQNVDKLPEFPKTSLPYLKFLNKEVRDKGDGTKVDRADFARLQRESLETYLIQLIRAVMFHPSSNRLAGFLEISALSVALAQSGGAQYKAGYMRIEATGGPGGSFGRKSLGWREKKEQRWCAVRESYLVVLEEPGELTVWDVFLLDSDFKIERPKRYYRQGLGNLLHPDKLGEVDQPPHTDLAGSEPPTDNGNLLSPNNYLSVSAHDSDKRSIISTIRNRASRIFLGKHPNGANGSANGSQPNISSGAGRESHEHNSDSADDESSSNPSSRPSTPMLDPSTNVNPLVKENDENDKSKEGSDGKTTVDMAKNIKKAEGDMSKHTFYVVNSQMRLKLIAKNERQMLQFITALEKTASTSHYIGSNRFDSFAPIRLNVAAQWLVDGRDYFWNLSRAMLLAKESIYIHDWWLSPELLMRRPNKDRYRLDRLLERKAKEGVKIYIILYNEVSNRTTPTDSNYAKQRLVALHPNIMVQRSPSHFQTGTFYWAHHEKMCVIDQTIAFMGGLDLCFGRWDSSQHVLSDDKMDTDEAEIWPGKDYSNPRLSDFYNLNKHDEDMYDRTKVPRMPWHDVAMQIVGQPARDMARHFVQRWNYLLRIKNHSRVMPFLLPPPEFRPGELSRMGLTGTCELQICRSAGPWSLGTPGKIEHSIQNAYLKAIQMSEHFVYIENQFFITSTVVNDVKVENNIGDAIVHRIIRAHRDRSPWKCCIMIPVLPGFTFPVDHSDASAIRIILECQNRTISRGPNSIFSRLRKEGIDPDEYVSVFSLRNWGKMRGDVLTTEQVYIHAKVCIVDDRLAIIGSANINERSQRGDRDSELAAVIRDTDMIDSTMAGKPFKVGRFAHTLRVRLMREHLGIDVDALDEADLMSHGPTKSEHEQEPWDPDSEQMYGVEGGGVTHIKKSHQRTRLGNLAADAADSIRQATSATVETSAHIPANYLRKMHLADASIAQNAESDTLEEERTDFNSDGRKERGFASSVVPTLEEKTVAEQRPPQNQVDSMEKDAPTNIDSEGGQNDPDPKGADNSVPHSEHHYRANSSASNGTSVNGSRSHNANEVPMRSSKGDTDDEQAARAARTTIRDNIMGKSTRKHAWTVPTKKPRVGPDDFEDPIVDSFWKNIWVASAVHNTEIYRKVFHAIPDDLITTWKQYKEFIAWHERLNKPTRGNTTDEPAARIPSESGDEGAHESQPSDTTDVGSETSRDDGEDAPPTPLNNSSSSATHGEEPVRPRRPTKGSEPFEKWERDEMEKLLGELNGHLVLSPNRFLEGEDIANNFLFNADRLLPLPIYL